MDGRGGVLLIIFYLLINKEDIPLIIDQPEDNSNITVVFDAEQIIYTEIDKFNKNINSKIIKVLEETMPAFANYTPMIEYPLLSCL